MHPGRTRAGRGTGQLIGIAFRLCVGFFAPTALGVLLLELVQLNPAGWRQPVNFMSAYLRLLGDVLPLVYVQAAIYTVTMEFVVHRLTGGYLVSAVVSALLCAMTAAGFTTTLMPYAAVAGLVVGWQLAIFYRFGASSIIR